MKLGKILVPLDGSALAEAVLRGTTVPILLVRVTHAPVERPTGKGVAEPWPEIRHV